MSDEDSSLTTQCLAFCQALASQGKAFSLSLTVGNTFSFSLDNREKTPPTKEKTDPAQERTTSDKAEVRKKKKKPSPSTLRRNAERRKEFLEKEPKTVKPAVLKPAQQAADSAPVSAVSAPRPEKGVAPGWSQVCAGPLGWRSLGAVTAPWAAPVPAPWPEQAGVPGLSLVSTPAAAPARLPPVDVEEEKQELPAPEAAAASYRELHCGECGKACNSRTSLNLHEYTHISWG
jgi:hypothetical protein